MISSLENFRPKLRAGRVIPHGNRIIFETENPYNQIVLPMALADLVMLCSGQFTVREIIEKVFKKQGTVPFRSILKTIHIFHQGGFFENGTELELNPHLRSWMEPKKARLNLSWRFGQRVLAEKSSPIGFYLLTMGMIVVSILGLQMLSTSPLQLAANWLLSFSHEDALLRFILCSSLLQTVRYLFRGIQLLLLTGRAYNVAVRLSPWGIHLHVGDEAHHIFENRLFITLFYFSQLIMGWSVVWALAPYMPPGWVEPLVFAATLITYFEMNPFVSSEGLRLMQALLMPNDRDSLSWHYENSDLINSLNPNDVSRDQDFSRICTIWGMLWLVLAVSILHESAIVFGPFVLSRCMSLTSDALFPIAGLLGWLATLYFVVQSLVETIAVAVAVPWWRRFKSKISPWLRLSRQPWNNAQIIDKIQDLPLFSHFHQSSLLRILEHSQVLDLNKDSVIIRQGDSSREIYVLLDGSVTVIRGNRGGKTEWLTELASVSIFGEAALLEDSPRAAEVTAQTRVKVLKVSVSAIRQIAQETHVIRHLDDFRNAILVNQFFASSAVFRSLSPSSIEFLSNRGSLEYMDQGHTVFKQGEMGEALYLILRGSVMVEVNGQQVKSIQQGNFFGEIALIANIPRTATVKTTEPSVLFRLSFDAFWEVLLEHIDLGVFIETIAEGRLREDLDVVVPLKPTGTGSQ